MIMLMKARLNILENLLIITDRHGHPWKAFRQKINYMQRRRAY